MKDNHRSILFIILAVICTMYIFHNSMATFYESSMQSGAIVSNANTFLSNLHLYEFQHVFYRKMAHIIEFLTLAILWSNVFKFNKNDTVIALALKFIVFPLILCSVTAVVDEFIQLHVPGRSGELRDVFLDIFGALIGILIINFIIRLKYRSQKKCNK